MGSLQTGAELQNDLNDSGLGQDESLTMKKQVVLEADNTVQLLDLSDDVLLYILKYCPPRDLKALGFTCSRLGHLVLDRTLWERIDARDCPVGMNRLAWLMKYAISSSTTELMLSGYAKEVDGCLGRLSYGYENDYEPYAIPHPDPEDFGDDPGPPEAGAGGAGCAEALLAEQNGGEGPIRRGIFRGGPVVQIYESMPRLDPYIPNGPMVVQRFPRKIKRSIPSNDNCPGPMFTLNNTVLVNIGLRCPNLTSLALEYCNLDCATTSIQHFPRTLKVLSLRGSKCYSQSFEKTFLFKIQDSLRLLEELNVSECDWVEPSTLLPLCKLPALRRLYMRNCCKMCECVAYSSLSTRYGFSSLQILDLRESPVGDSEISSFGWVASLEELYVSPAPERRRVTKHGHYSGDKMPEHRELDSWEEQEPEYMDKLSKAREFNGDEPTENRDDNNSNLLKRKRMIYSCDTYEDALKYAIDGQRLPSFDPPDDNDAVETKRSRQNGVNEGASTSKSSGNSDKPSTSSDGSSFPTAGDLNGNPSGSGIQNAFPVHAACEHVAVEGNEDMVRSQSPVQKVLYVNVCRKLHAMYRLSMPVYAVEEPADALADNPARRLDVSTGPFTTYRYDPTTLVSDASIHRFGRADTDNVNYINIGPNGIQHDHRATRPDRSNLRILYITGFRNITNRSLIHLATAAPMLTMIDFTGTRVNERGVQHFKTVRPDCEVLFTKGEDRRAKSNAT